MAQVTPRVPAGDPLLARAEAFYSELDRTQQVPPAIRSVYGVDLDALTPDQRHEVLLLLSSLNQCPGVSAELQQSVLEVFDELAPQPVVEPDTDGSVVGDSSAPADDTSASAEYTGEQIRSDTIESDDDYYADGSWGGHAWWFRPCWTHPSPDHDTWERWGRDRRDGIWWGWTGSRWERYGANRPADDHPHTGHSDGTHHVHPWIPGRHGLPVSPGPGENPGTGPDEPYRWHRPGETLPGDSPGGRTTGSTGTWHREPTAGSPVGPPRTSTSTGRTWDTGTVPEHQFHDPGATGSTQTYHRSEQSPIHREAQPQPQQHYQPPPPQHVEPPAPRSNFASDGSGIRNH
jgi:hypothetical protein